VATTRVLSVAGPGAGAFGREAHLFAQHAAVTYVADALAAIA
jgi:hypothetical protein